MKKIILIGIVVIITLISACKDGYNYGTKENCIWECNIEYEGFKEGFSENTQNCAIAFRNLCYKECEKEFE